MIAPDISPELEVRLVFSSASTADAVMGGSQPRLHEGVGGPEGVGGKERVQWVVVVKNELVNGSAAAAGTGRNRMERLYPTGLGGLLLWLIAAALIGTAPRCIVLLACQALPQVAPSQAVDTFMDSWQTCAAGSQVFSDFSADGIVFRVMVASDHAFTFIGTTMAVVAMVALGVNSISRGSRRSQRAAWLGGMAVAAPALALVGLLVRTVMVFSGEVVSFHALDSVYSLRWAFFLAAFVYLVVAVAMLMLCPNRGQSLPPEGRFDCLSSFWNVVRLLPTLGTCACCFLYIIWAESILDFFGTLFSPLGSIVAASFAIRTLNLGMRALGTQNNLPVQLVNMASLLFLSHASLAFRKFVMDESGDQLSKLFINFLTLGAVETVARCGSFVFHALTLAVHMQYTYNDAKLSRNSINTMTLDGLLEVHGVVERRVDHFAVYQWVDQFVEVFLCIMIAAQELSAPVWSLYRTWLSVEAWHHRAPSMLASAAIQMGVELVVDGLVWHTGRRMVPFDVSRAFRRVLARRFTAVFVLGVMLMHSVAYFPNCMVCRWPVHCVLFTECLFDGEVMVNGQNACSSKMHNRTNYAEQVLLERRSHAQGEILPEQLGCGRQDGVDCFGLESSKL